MTGSGEGAAEAARRTWAGPRSSWSRTGRLCTSRNSQRRRRSGPGRKRRTSEEGTAPPGRTCPRGRGCRRWTCEGEAEIRPRNQGDCNRSPYNRLPSAGPCRSFPCRTPGGRATTPDRCGFSRRRRCFDRPDSLSTSGRASRRHSSQCDFPFPERCGADWWTAVRSSACLLKRKRDTHKDHVVLFFFSLSFFPLFF